MMGEKYMKPWGKSLMESAQELGHAALKKSSQSSHFLPGVWDHISMVMDDVHDLEQRIQKAKNNVEEIQTIVGSWASPIFVRRDCKRESLLSLEDCQDRLERRYSLVREAGQRIHLLVKENQSLLLADPASDIWKAYVDDVDEIVLDGFFTAIECSLKYLLENTDPKAGLPPLFEVQLDLVIPDLIFQPSLDPGTNDGFYDVVEGLLNDIYRISSLVPRLAEHSGFLHYQVRGCGAPSRCVAVRRCHAAPASLRAPLLFSPG
ncbi:dynein axonemal heavy chain 9-like [Patagioenas fasciata]|uniref:dynein axonemal heavy chain 9-like n=1 Tax=Patagioenas fasciata TaxID=372321 RepID=UPI003A998241